MSPVRTQIQIELSKDHGSNNANNNTNGINSPSKLPMSAASGDLSLKINNASGGNGSPRPSSSVSSENPDLDEFNFHQQLFKRDRSNSEPRELKPSTPLTKHIQQPILKPKINSQNESLMNNPGDFVKGKRLIDPVTGRTEDEIIADNEKLSDKDVNKK